MKFSRKKSALVLIDNLIRLMALAEQEKKEGRLIDGNHKKEWVMKELKKILIWDDSIIDEIILIVIDTLIEVDNGKLKFNQKVKKSLFCCFK